MLDRTPLGRFATAEEVAAVIAFLLSPAASYVNGTVVDVDGGLTAGYLTHQQGSDYALHTLRAAYPGRSTHHARNQSIIGENPLGQVPTLLSDGDGALYDSRVICEYLDAQAGGGKLFPAAGPDRWRALREQALGDGLLGAALLARYEAVLRPEDKRWDDWTTGQMDKVHTALDQFEAWAADFGSRVDIGTITAGCAMGYLDFRFPTLPWRGERAKLAAWFEMFDARPSMMSSRP